MILSERIELLRSRRNKETRLYLRVQVMVDESLRAQNWPRKPLIFPGFFDQMAIKPTDFGHDLQP